MDLSKPNVAIGVTVLQGPRHPSLMKLEESEIREKTKDIYKRRIYQALGEEQPCSCPVTKAAIHIRLNPETLGRVFQVYACCPTFQDRVKIILGL